LKKIAFVVPDLGGGGAEKALVVTANRFSLNNKVTIVLFKDSGILRQNVYKNIEILILNKDHKKILQIPSLLLRLRKTLRDYDIVFCGYQLFTEFYVYVSQIGIKNKIISVIQTNVTFMMKKINIYNFLFKFIVRNLYNRMSVIVCASNGIKDDIIENVKVKKTNIKVIYNPLYFFDNGKSPQNYEFEYPVFITLARLSYQKRVDLIIKGFEMFFKKNQKGTLIILGDGDEKQSLKKLIEEYNMQEHIRLMGFVHNIKDYLSSSHVFLLTSDVEGFGNVLIEAMYYGLPVISTDCTGPVEVLKNGKYGIIIKKGDFRELSRKMEFLIKNRDIYNNLKKLGKNRAEEFDIEKIYGEYEKII
jgi:glycosyltransferase involved in cell wall biosynthesis